MDTPLNKAHIYVRKARSNFGKIEAKEYLEKAIESFAQALKQSSSPKAIESIEIQKSYYEKQLNLLNLKKALYDKCVDRVQKDDTIKFDVNEQIESATNLQLDLFRVLSSNEKALEELTRNNPNTTELQELNTQFNFLLCKLFKFVDETVRENVALKERKHDDEVKPPPSLDNQPKDNVISHQEQREQTSGESEDDDVSDLPPLECPEFDLDK